MDADHPARRVNFHAVPNLDAALLWDVFEQKVWKAALLPAVRETLQRAKDELGTKLVTVVLLSGGSSNIR